MELSFLLFPFKPFLSDVPYIPKSRLEKNTPAHGREGSLASNGLSKGHQARTQTVPLLALAETSSISSHENITPW